MDCSAGLKYHYIAAYNCNPDRSRSAHHIEASMRWVAAMFGAHVLDGCSSVQSEPMHFRFIYLQWGAGAGGLGPTYNGCGVVSAS